MEIVLEGTRARYPHRISGTLVRLFVDWRFSLPRDAFCEYNSEILVFNFRSVAQRT
jgi:hypothetical protein